MDASHRQQLIAQYREGPGVVEALVGSLSEADLDRAPAEGGWTAREVVHHLADSEMTSAIRVRRLLAEDNPEIQGYDESVFARRLHYDSRPPGPSLEALRASRESTADLLDRLGEDDWARSGTHTESGPGYTVERWLEIYAAHAHDHAEQIRKAVAG
jgi:DinB superfamily